MNAMTLDQIKDIIGLVANNKPVKTDRKTTVKVARSIFTIVAISQGADLTPEMFRDVDRWAAGRLMPTINVMVDLMTKHLRFPDPPAFPTIGPITSCNDLDRLIGGRGACRTGRAVDLHPKKRPMPKARVHSALHPEGAK